VYPREDGKSLSGNRAVPKIHIKRTTGEKADRNEASPEQVFKGKKSGPQNERGGRKYLSAGKRRIAVLIHLGVSLFGEVWGRDFGEKKRAEKSPRRGRNWVTEKRKGGKRELYEPNKLRGKKHKRFRDILIEGGGRKKGPKILPSGWTNRNKTFPKRINLGSRLKSRYGKRNEALFRRRQALGKGEGGGGGVRAILSPFPPG